MRMGKIRNLLIEIIEKKFSFLIVSIFDFYENTNSRLYILFLVVKSMTEITNIGSENYQKLVTK